MAVPAAHLPPCRMRHVARRVKGTPQSPQNCLPAGFSALHFGHGFASAPIAAEFLPTGFSVAHFQQRIARLPRAGECWSLETDINRSFPFHACQ